ncbi:MAG: glycosyltransferase [Verrucomicrobiota bacterium]
MAPADITVLMSVRNGGHYLAPAIQSIIDQTYEGWEFLIVDNASTDDTVNTVQSFCDSRIRLIELPEDLGQVGALSLGLEHIKTRYTARLDADDISLPDRLFEKRSILESNKSLLLVGSSYQVIDEDGVASLGRTVPTEDMSLRWMQLFENPLAHSSFFFRTDKIKELGGYDPEYKIAMDYDLLLRVLSSGPVGAVHKPLIQLRLHPGSESQNRKEATYDESRKIIRRSFKELLGENLDEHTKNDPGGVLYGPCTDPEARLEVLQLAKRSYQKLYPAAFDCNDIWNDYLNRMGQLSEAWCNPSSLPVAITSVLNSWKVIGFEESLNRLIRYLKMQSKTELTGPLYWLVVRILKTVVKVASSAGT